MDMNAEAWKVDLQVASAHPFMACVAVIAEAPASALLTACLLTEHSDGHPLLHVYLSIQEAMLHPVFGLWLHGLLCEAHVGLSTQQMAETR